MIKLGEVMCQFVFATQISIYCTRVKVKQLETD